MKGKFESKWEESFIIEQVYDGGAYQLMDHQGLHPMPPINGAYLMKYFLSSSVNAILPLLFFNAFFIFLRKMFYKMWTHKSFNRGFSFTTRQAG
jgi:hypothetical protein